MRLVVSSDISHMSFERVVCVGGVGISYVRKMYQ